MGVLGQDRARGSGWTERRQAVDKRPPSHQNLLWLPFQLPVVDSMWVQMEWFCPQTTHRTIPVDRPACILSPCLRTMVGFPWFAFLFSDSSLPCFFQNGKPIVGPGRTVSLAGQHSVLGYTRRRLPGQRRKKGIHRHGGGHELKVADKGQVPQVSSAQHRLAGIEGQQLQPAGGRGMRGRGSRKKEGGGGMETAFQVPVREAEWEPRHFCCPSEENPAAVSRKSKEPMRQVSALRSRRNFQIPRYPG